MGERVKDVYVTWEICEKEVYVMMDVKEVYVMGEICERGLCDGREIKNVYVIGERLKKVCVMRERLRMFM
jgi:hypothetical protein